MVWALAGLDADGRAIYGPGRAAVDLSARARLTSPEEAPVALEVVAGLRERQARVRALRLAVGDTGLEAVGEVDLTTWKGRAALLSLKVDAAAVGRLAPQARLASDLDGTLYAESDGALATLALDLAARNGGGRARAAAASRLPPGELAAGAELHLTALDLARVLRGMPLSALDLDATLSARGGFTLATLIGSARVSVAPSRLRGGSFGPAELRATVDRGAVAVSRLTARAPGLALEGSGAWREQGPLSGRLDLDASDLAAARRNLGALLARELPPVSGRLKASANLSGTAAAPALALQLTLPRLEAAGARVLDAALTLSARGPLDAPSGELEGRAAEVARAGTAMREVALRAKVAGREGEVSLRGALPLLGPEAVSVDAKGTLSPDARTLTLSGLALAWPEASFALVRPARFDLTGPSVDRLELAGRGGEVARAQRLAISGGLKRRKQVERLDARLEVNALQLAAIPRALMPQDLGLAGQLSAEVSASGRPAAPEVTARVELAGGAAMGLRGLGAKLDGRYDGRRGRASFTLGLVRDEGGELRATGDLPVALARAPRSSPLALDLEVEGVAVAEALRLARQELPVALDGRASLGVHLSGTVGAPALRAEARLAGGRVAEVSGLDLAVEVEDPGRALRLTAALDRDRSRTVNLELSAPLDLAALLRAPASTGRALAGAPLELKLWVPGLDLATVAGRFGIPAGIEGTLTASVELAGSPRAPRGTARAALANGVYGEYRQLAAELEVVARDDATALTGAASVAGVPLLRMTGSLALPPEAMADARRRETAHLEGRLEIPEADLAQARGAFPVTGIVSGEATAKGSLAEPDLEGRPAREGAGDVGAPAGRPDGEREGGGAFGPGRAAPRGAERRYPRRRGEARGGRAAARAAGCGRLQGARHRPGDGEEARPGRPAGAAPRGRAQRLGQARRRAHRRGAAGYAPAPGQRGAGGRAGGCHRVGRLE